MKFVDIDELLKKYPNRYLGIVAASKEARKIIEARKPPPLPKEGLQTTAETAVPEPALIESSIPKKRGRKPKNLTAASVEAEKTLPKTEAKESSSSIKANITIKGRGVSAEKADDNPYIEALKRILK